MQYFSACYTKEQAKTEYRRLAKIHHPDLGGDLQTMKEINSQYDAFQAHGGYTRPYQPQPQPKAQKPRKPRKTKIYTVRAVQNAIDRSNANGGCARHYKGGVIVIEEPGMKTIVAIPTERNGVTYYTIKRYNVTPKKYAM